MTHCPRSLMRLVVRWPALAVMAAALSAVSAWSAPGTEAPMAGASPSAVASAPLSTAPVAAASMASRVLACTACHGKQGRATQEGYFPRIAGKPAGYLGNQLLNFRDGRRSYPQMGYLIEHLTDDYLREMAAYFSGQDVPYPAPPAPQAPAAALERGRLLVHQGDSARRIPACVSCHGAAMTGVAPSIPGLLGLPRDYLNSQLGAWKTGQRRAQAPDCMADVAQKLTPDDVSAVSAWLAAQPVAGSGKAATRLPAAMPVRCGGVADVPVAGGPTVHTTAAVASATTR